MNLYSHWPLFGSLVNYVRPSAICRKSCFSQGSRQISHGAVISEEKNATLRAANKVRAEVRVTKYPLTPPLVDFLPIDFRFLKSTPCRPGAHIYAFDTGKWGDRPLERQRSLIECSSHKSMAPPGRCVTELPLKAAGMRSRPSLAFRPEETKKAWTARQPVRGSGHSETSWLKEVGRMPVGREPTTLFALLGLPRAGSRPLATSSTSLLSAGQDGTRR